MPIANDITKGKIIDHKSKLWKVAETSHVKPGKGGAFVQVTAFGVQPENRGTKLTERFRSTENVEFARIDERSFNYLFADGELITLMDNETYEQIDIGKDLFEGKDVYLKDGIEVAIEYADNAPLIAKVPEKIQLKIIEAEAVVKGQTASGSNKPAVLENGLKIMVPPFIKADEEVIIRTSGDNPEYIERAK